MGGARTHRHTRRHTRRPMLAGVGLVAAGALISAGLVAAQTSGGATTPETALTAIDPALLDDARPSISDDGRWLLTQTLLDQRATVVLRDQSTGDEVELTPVPPSARPGHSVAPVLSADACTVTVTTELALDPFRDDDADDRWDIYQLLLPECGGEFGAWELVSSTVDGTARDDIDPAAPVSVSATGSRVAFVHPWPGAPDLRAITLADLTEPIGAPTRLIAVETVADPPPTDTVSRHAGLDEPSLSADGTRLAFSADLTIGADGPIWAEAAEAGDWAPRRVFVWDRAEPELDALDDPAADAAPTSVLRSIADAEAASPVISADGQVVAFVSSDQGLVEATYPACRDERCPTQVFAATVPDEVARPVELSLVSAVSGPADDDAGDDALPVAGDRSSWLGHVNLDGSQVVFVTRAGNLSEISVPAGGDADGGDLYLAELGLGTLTRVTDLIGAGVPAAHSHPRFSASGRRLVFDTLVGARFEADAPAAPTPEAAGEPAAEPTPEPAPDAAALADQAAPALAPTVAPTVRGVTTVQAPVAPQSAEPEPAQAAPAESNAAERTVVAIATMPVISMPDLDFGSVVAGLASDERFVRVLNEGPGVFQPHRITTTDPQFRITGSGTCRNGVVVAAGSACTVTLAFTPALNADVRAQLVVSEDPARGDEAVTVVSQLSGAGGDPVIRVSPAGVEIPEVVIGEVDESGELVPARFDVVGFTNIGESWVQFAEVSLSSEHFNILTEDCTGRTLGPSERCEVAVAYRPVSAGSHSAVLRVGSSNQQYGAAVFSGSAVYRPVLETYVESVLAGEPVGLALTGYPADADVVVGFADRPASWTSVRTDADGRAMALVETRPLERAGERQIVAIGPGSLRSATEIDIRRPNRTALGIPGSGYGFGGG